MVDDANRKDPWEGDIEEIGRMLDQAGILPENHDITERVRALINMRKN